MAKALDVKALDRILDRMINTLTDSKDEIFQIGEQCRNDYETLSRELRELRTMIAKIIDEGDRLETLAQSARNDLSTVSRNFNEYSEEQVKEAYEKAHQIQMDYIMNRELEKQLRKRRDELERRLQGLHETIERAEHLVAQTTFVLNYLTSDLKQVGEVLEEAKMKQDFGLKIIMAQEEERKRLSREIHDGPAQMLANVMMRSDLVERLFKEYGSEAALEEIRSLKKMVRDALYEVRRIIYDLRPMALDDLGLSPTLRKYLRTIEDYYRTATITYQFFGKEQRLDSKTEVSLFRLVQEAVQNALKHAEANEITVKVEMKNNLCTIIVRDDGKGFDVNQKKEKSFGIMGMRERVELLNGTLSIKSTIGAGTVVTIQVPINKRK